MLYYSCVAGMSPAERNLSTMHTTDEQKGAIGSMMLVGIICEALSTLPEDEPTLPTSSLIFGLMMQAGQHPENVVHGIQEGHKFGLIEFHNQPDEDSPPEALSLTAKGKDAVAGLCDWLTACEAIIQKCEDPSQVDYTLFPATPTFD
jgi:hypothetical protein